MLVLDTKLAALLSDFSLDIAKAWFIAIFVSMDPTKISTFSAALWFLTKGLANVTLFLYLSWVLAKEVK
jgi:hypothetical protein